MTPRTGEATSISHQQEVRMVYDMIIAGAGPAGMTASVYAARQKENALLLSSEIGGQLNWTLGIENYLGYQFIEGAELVSKFEEQIKKFPMEMKIGKEIKALSRTGDGFEIECTDGSRFSARVVLVCTGKRPKTLDVPGEEKLRGRGVAYCGVCDAPLFQDMDVVVVGGGNSALESTEALTKIARNIYLVSLTPLTGDAILREKVMRAKNTTVMTEHVVTEVIGEGMVSAVGIKDLKTGSEKSLEVGGVLIEIGLLPNSEFLRGMLTLNELGEVMVNCACETGIAGLYAAGDVTNVPAKQIVVAAGEGAKAALQAHNFLLKCP